MFIRATYRNRHKLQIYEFHDSTYSSLAKISVTELAKIHFDEAKFLSLNHCKEVIVARDNTSEYASVAKSIRKSTTHIIQQLAEHYQNEFDE